MKRHYDDIGMTMVIMMVTMKMIMPIITIVFTMRTTIGRRRRERLR